ncbi:MAG: class I SAM-dependent RNA methyltransferase, partial [Clostridia bacterium]|nr:class I SAM-dependent RNA methyltransferase [Clostridia bacterium]
MKKNDVIELSIVDMTHEGNGIGRYEGCAVFVPHSAPGDLVQVKIIKTTKSYAVGHLEKVIMPSKSRIEPDCPVWRPCGGCCYRHISYEAECAIKLKRVNDCLARLGGVDCRAQEILPSPVTQGYRNKAQYPIGLDKDGNPVLGFYAPKSHRIVPVSGCNLQPKEFDLLCSAFLEYVKV